MKYYEKSKSIPELYCPEKTLSELANHYETDKGTADSKTLTWGYSHSGHFTWGYTEVYEKYMKHFRDTKDPVQFLEVGILDGRFPLASPKVWLSYFKNLNLYCIDNFWGAPPNDDIAAEICSLGVNFFYADQGSEEHWNEIQKQISQPLDFIVEDGSHWPNHMLYTLWRSIPLMRSGGFYFMEDLQHETTQGVYGYNNHDLYHSMLKFKSTGVFESQILSYDICKDIESAFTVTDIHLGGPSHNITVLCALQKK